MGQAGRGGLYSRRERGRAWAGPGPPSRAAMVGNTVDTRGWSEHSGDRKDWGGQVSIMETESVWDQIRPLWGTGQT